MQNTKKSTLYAIISAICFILYVVTYVIILYKNANKYDNYHIKWTTYVWLGIFIIQAILLFIRKKNFLLLVPPALATLLSVYWFIPNYNFYYKILGHNFINFVIDDVGYIYIGYIVIYVFLFILLYINIFPSTKKAVSITKILCFVPAALVLAFFISEHVIYHLKLSFDIYLLEKLMQVVAFLFLGLWLKATAIVPEKKEVIQQNTYTSVGPQSTISQYSQVESGADKIRMYKDLLDSGVITQEEFEAKKKQILGL